MADYNDTQGALDIIRRNADDLAAVIVEPILGAAGNIPGTPEFLRTLRSETERCGALLIFDEVKTSRCGAAGMQGRLKIIPDLTTLGKYLGGGLPSGAFGGRRDVMGRFDHRSASPLKHAGTFNNNVCTMIAGFDGLTKIFTPDRAESFTADCEQFRTDLNTDMAKKDVPVQFVGFGSLITAHFSKTPIASPKDIPLASKKIGQLFHMENILRSILVAARGDIFISLAVSGSQLEDLRAAVNTFVEEYRPLIKRELELQ